MPDLHIDRLIAQGQTAVVFRSNTGGRVLKLFKFLQPGRSEARIRAAFAAEREAYEIVTLQPRLRHHAPQFFGAPRIDAVWDGNTDVSHRYLLDCCLELESLHGDSLSAFAVEPPHRFRVLMLLKRFERAGIDYVLDSEIFNWQDPDRMKLIDFAVRDARADYPDQQLR